MSSASFFKKIFLTGAVLTVGFLFLTGEQETKAAEGFFHLSWQADGDVPVDYSGKSLVVADGVVKVLAQPFIYSGGKQVDASKWSYSWYVNEKLMTEEGGEPIFRFRIRDYFKDVYQIKLKVSSPSGSVWEENLDVLVVSPRIIVSSQKGGLGMEKGIFYTNLGQAELRADYYFFSSSQSPFKFQWFVDGKYKLGNNKNSLIIEKGDLAERKVEVIVSSILDSLIRGTGELIVRFASI